MAFLELIPRWVLVAAVVALGLAAAALSFQLSASELALADEKAVSADLRTDVANLNTAIAEAGTRAAEQKAELASLVVKAQNEAKKREADLRAAANAAAAESDGLRDDLAAMRSKYDKLSRDAVIDRAIAVDLVLTQCTARYQGMADKADRHASDVKTLIDAWPRSPAPDPSTLPR